MFILEREMVEETSNEPELNPVPSLNVQNQDSASDESVTKAAEEPLDEQNSSSEPMECSDSNVTDELQKMNSTLQEVKGALQEKEKLLQMNVEMHAELVELRNGLVDTIKKPLLMGLIQIYDRLEDLVRFNNGLPESETAALKMLKTLNDIRLNCLDVLYEFDVEPVEPKIGDEFNPKEHKAIKIIATESAARDRLIASVRQAGFINVSNSRMLRPCSVEVFKKQA